MKANLWFVEEGVIGGPHLGLLDHWSTILRDHLIILIMNHDHFDQSHYCLITEARSFAII